MITIWKSLEIKYLSAFDYTVVRYVIGRSRNKAAAKKQNEHTKLWQNYSSLKRVIYEMN